VAARPSLSLVQSPLEQPVHTAATAADPASAPPGSAPAVRACGITRRFGATVALDGVDVEIRRGEIHALLGENGAGKTTLVRILAGLDRPDAGSVEVQGEAVDRFEPRHLRARGVALVQQHFTLVPTLTAGENLVLARPEGRWLPGSNAGRDRIQQLVARYGLAVPAERPVAGLSVGQQQRLEVLRALDADASVLLLDEPTAVLTDQEAAGLLATCRQLAGEERAVVVITHRLAEVFAGCDRVTVLRAGRVVLAGAAVSGQTRAGLASLMVGSAASGLFARPELTGDGCGAASLAASPAPARKEVRLQARGLTQGLLADLDLEVRGGEVVGLAGVDGNGQADLESVLCGRQVPRAGEVLLDGTALPPGRPRKRVAAGMAYIPSDRYRWGLVRALDLADNLDLGRTPCWRLRRRVRQRQAQPRLTAWDVRGAGPWARAATLSGGNAQKLVLAREMAGGPPAAVVACYPTRGLDPEAAGMIATRVLEAAAAGSAVVWMGAELDELVAVADRIMVMTGGRLVGPFLPPFDRAAIGLAMAGGAESS
jgi:simple sugar transport system ATP-binding protein